MGTPINLTHVPELLLLAGLLCACSSAHCALRTWLCIIIAWVYITVHLFNRALVEPVFPALLRQSVQRRQPLVFGVVVLATNPVRVASTPEGGFGP